MFLPVIILVLKSGNGQNIIQYLYIKDCPVKFKNKKGGKAMFTRMNDFDRMFEAMGLLRNRMDRIFNEFDRSFAYTPGLNLDAGTPRTNLIDNADSFEVRAEAPGVSKDDLEIKIQGNYLEISGKRVLSTPEGYKVHRNERGSSTFSRSFTLPADVDADKVEANLKDGILYLILPKSEAAKPKQIAIN
jgi:HSP20 family protein